MPNLLTIEELETDREYLIKQRDNTPQSPWGTARIMWDQRIAEVERQLRDLQKLEGSKASVALIFDGLPVIGQRDIRVDFSSEILATYQKIVTAWLAGLGDKEVKGKGKIKDAEKSKLYIRDLVRGSMGFVLEEIQPQAEMFESRLSEAVEGSTRFLQNLNTADENAFESQIDDAAPRLVGAVQRLTKILKDNGATARIVGNRHEARFTLEDVKRMAERFADVKIDEVEVVLSGVLWGILPGSHDFELRLSDEQGERVLEGSVTDDLATKYLSDAAFKEQLLLKPVRAFVRYVRTYRKDRLLKEQIVMENLEPDEQQAGDLVL